MAPPNLSQLLPKPLLIHWYSNPCKNWISEVNFRYLRVSGNSDQRNRMMRLILIILFVFSFTVAFTSFGEQKIFEGTFTIYTKHKDCEVVKTHAIFSNDHSFTLYSTCNGVDYKQFSRKNAQEGSWHFLSDSLVEVSFAKRPSIKFKILSDSLIELQNGSRSSKPKYKRE